MRISLKSNPTSREKKEKKKIHGSKYQADHDKIVQSDSVDVPDRMQVIWRENPLNRWLCLTPREWNIHVGYFVAIPVTVERTKLDPFEYSFALDRVTQIALCSQPKSIRLNSPYLVIGTLSKYDHQQISKTMAKILFDPGLADTL